MSKQPDFGNDLAALHENVTASVGDVLQVLQQKRATKLPEAIQKTEEIQAAPMRVGEQVAEAESSAGASPPRRPRLASRSRLTPTIERDEPLENVTTRLRQKTNGLLTESALRQRLKKESPSTRQDIIEAALGDWFRKHGYGRDRDEEIAE
ncbi:MAG: hypothetical protein JNL18_23250 [Planctomycetaceae bacterium]|uniref:Uncharacterized protein n=1 Tax=Lacipirellula limnantheis TaxID=2528024 RepID=A0A517TSE9_9BACT|nr:hypothetical protein [Lacipirellula limnantheis]MBL9165659.1 hypothetical protein [Planctomycetaceae bacterium]QDT71302.1 hypothetical protein I41_04590 [Lacipirellula limnantheis]